MTKKKKKSPPVPMLERRQSSRTKSSSRIGAESRNSQKMMAALDDLDLDMESSPIIGKVIKPRSMNCKRKSLDIELTNALVSERSGIILSSQPPGNSGSITRLVKEDIIVPLKQFDNNTLDLSFLENIDLEISSKTLPINADTPPTSPCMQAMVCNEEVEESTLMLNNIYELYYCYHNKKVSSGHEITYTVQTNRVKSAFTKLLFLKNQELKQAITRIKELEGYIAHNTPELNQRIKELEEKLITKEKEIQMQEQNLAYILNHQNTELKNKTESVYPIDANTKNKTEHLSVPAALGEDINVSESASSKVAPSTTDEPLVITAATTGIPTPSPSHNDLFTTSNVKVAPVLPPQNKLAPAVATPALPFYQTPPDPVVMLQIETMKAEFENLRRSVYQKFDEMSKPLLETTIPSNNDEETAENHADNEEEKKQKKNDDLQLQLKKVRELKHIEYNDDERGEKRKNYTWVPPPLQQGKDSGTVNCASLPGNDKNVVRWKEGTILITGDSMLNNIDERKIKNCKVRAHPGASIEQMYYHLAVHLQKKPTQVILLTGTNNCTTDTGRDVFEKLMKLKTFILSRCCCEVYISTLITRIDNQKAGRMVDDVNKQLLDLNDKGVLKLLDNTGITKSHLGRKGLHLSDRGTGKLITNIVSLVKRIRGF